MMNMDERHFPYGAVIKVQREYSMEKIHQIMQSMRDSGMDYAVVWPSVYWWEDERQEGYPFNTGRQILEYANKVGLKIIMELGGQITCLEYAPDFLMKPEYFAVDQDGHKRINQPSFGEINYNHPEVKGMIRRIFTQTVESYKQYDSLYGYDIWNETMFTSFDEYTLNEFRRFLEDKYQTIKQLNDVWDRTYADFWQVEFPYWRWASITPNADLFEFRAANIGKILQEWTAIVKSVDPLRPVLADNIGSELTDYGLFNRGQDNSVLAKSVDEPGMSFYPLSNSQFRDVHHRRSLTLSAFYASAQRPFWIAELQSHHTTLLYTDNHVYPHEIRWWNWEAIAHGAKGIIYWKWEPFIKGHQLFGRGLVDHKGRRTERLDEAVKIKQILDTNPELSQFMPQKAKVGIIYNRKNVDFEKAFALSYGEGAKNIYEESINNLYRSLWERNIAVDIITEEMILSGGTSPYTVIFSTYDMHISDAFAAALCEYIKKGGVVIADGMFGIFNQDGVMFEDLPGGEHFKDCGIDLLDTQACNLDFKLDNQTYQGSIQRQLIKLDGATALAKFDDGYPAISSSKMGKGEFMYIATSYWHGCMDSQHNWVDYVIERYNLHECGHTLKCSILDGGNTSKIAILFNYTPHQVESDIRIRGFANGSYTQNDLYSQTKMSITAANSEICTKIKVDGYDVKVLLFEPR